MNWDALKNMACPKCGSSLDEAGNAMYACVRNTCDFRITKKRFDEVVESLYKPKARRCGTFSEEDNLSALNNL